jgi:hypothetical protein
MELRNWQAPPRITHKLRTLDFKRVSSTSYLFFQRVMTDISEHFQSVEDAISNDFLPAMFGESYFEEDDYR